LQEELVTSHAVVARTAYQRIFEIARFKAMAEQDMGRVLSAAEVANVYHSRASSCSGELFTAGFVDNALTVHERAFRLPEVRQMIVRLEDLCGTASPFNSVTKLHFIVKRSKFPSQGMSNDDALLWLFGWVVDVIVSKQYKAEDLTVRVLGGEQTKKTAKHWHAVAGDAETRLVAAHLGRVAPSSFRGTRRHPIDRIQGA
jgi:hypothetical protein